MIGVPAAPPSAPMPSFSVFWNMLGKLVSQYMNNRAHCDFVIQIKNGNIELLRVNQSFLPAQLPRI